MGGLKLELGNIQDVETDSRKITEREEDTLKNEADSSISIVKGNECFYRKRMIKRVRTKLDLCLQTTGSRMELVGLASISFEVKTISEIPITLELGTSELYHLRINNHVIKYEEISWSNNKIELFGLKKGANLIQIIYRNELPEYYFQNFKENRPILLHNTKLKALLYPAFLQNSLRHRISLTLLTREEIGDVITSSEPIGSLLERCEEIPAWFEDSLLLDYYLEGDIADWRVQRYKEIQNCTIDSFFICLVQSPKTFVSQSQNLSSGVWSKSNSVFLNKSRSRNLLDRIYLFWDGEGEEVASSEIEFLRDLANEVLTKMQKDLDLNLHLKHLSIYISNFNFGIKSFNHTILISKHFLRSKTTISGPEYYHNLAISLIKSLSEIFFGNILTNTK